MKLSRLALAMAALSLPLAAQANQSLTAPGYAGTIGGVSNEGTIHSSSFNPASNGILLDETDRFRFGYFSNLGGYVEIGESEDLDTKINDLSTDMEDAENMSDGTSASQHLIDRYGPKSGTTDEQQAKYYEAIVKNANNNLVADLEKGGQFRTGIQVQAPLTPFLFRTDSARGVFSLNASADVQTKIGFLGDQFAVSTKFSIEDGADLGDLNLNLEKVAAVAPTIKNILDDVGKSDEQKVKDVLSIVNNEGLLEGNEETVENLANQYGLTLSDYGIATSSASVSGASSSLDLVEGAAAGDLVTETSISTDAGIDARVAAVGHFALGYGTRLSDWMNMNTEYGELEIGTRLNMYAVEAGRTFISFEAEANSSLNNNDEDEDTFDQAMDDFSENTEQTVGFGLDLGFLWHSKNYQAGVTFYNLNEPEFDYPDLSEYLDATALSALQGLEGSGKSRVADSVTLTRHAVVEGAVYSSSRNWMLQGSYTLGEATNFVGDEFQTISVSAGYFPKAWWAPGLRAGYSQNLVGSELSKAHAGLTLFGILHMDAAVALETSSFDDTDIPRYASFSMGLEEKF
ncbi:conjugal transfer protein TraF [Marinospirillum sp.]|uniref:conjugal transfer protein TraF n=1 Tax=Marinospirillum sp. TaxID=2183934 RepID=UPI0028700B04|nr:conjugal transfer protein TraF [Marinospirillum sp.]MDR9469427.1 conjugal transfer protein TraF [Marinospirillum sp.]